MCTQRLPQKSFKIGGPFFLMCPFWTNQFCACLLSIKQILAAQLTPPRSGDIWLWQYDLYDNAYYPAPQANQVPRSV